MGLKFKISLLDKISAPLKKVNVLFDKITKNAGKTQTKIKVLPNSIGNLETKLESLQIAQKKAFTVQGIKYYQKEIDTTARKLRKLEKHKKGSFGKRAGNFVKTTGGQMAAGMAGYFALDKIFDFGGKVIQTTAEFEKYNAVLTNTLGSSAKAKTSFDLITDFASKTPFQISELNESFVKLSNRGFVPTMTQMRKMGDVASSVGKSFDQFTEAMLDATTGEFERLKEFGIKASKSGDKVSFTFKGQTKTVKNTDKAIQDYLLSLGDMQGVSGSMAAISGTLGGKISNLQDKITMLQYKIGKTLKPVISSVIGQFAKWIEMSSGIVNWFSKHEGVMKVLAIGIGGVITAIAVWIPLQWALNLAVSSNPVGAIIMGVVGLAAGIAVLIVKMNSIISWFNKLNTITKIFVGIAGVVFAVLTPVYAVILGLAFVVRKLIDNWKKITFYVKASITVFTSITGAISMVVSSIKNKLIDVLVPVISNVKSLFVEFKNKIVEVFFKIKNSIVNTFSSIKEKVMPIVEKLIAFFFKIKNTVQKIFTGIAIVMSSFLLPVIISIGAIITASRYLIHNWIKITSVFKSFIGAISMVVSSIKNKLIDVLVPVISNVKSLFVEFKNKIVEVFFKIKNSIVNTLLSIKNSIVNAFLSIKNSIVNTFSSIKNRIVNTFSSIKNRIVNTFSSIKNRILDFVLRIKEFIKPVANVIIAPFLKIKDVVFGVFQKIFDFLTEKFAFIGVLAERLGLKDLAKTFKSGFSDSVKKKKLADMQNMLRTSATGAFIKQKKTETTGVPPVPTSPIADVTAGTTSDIITGGKQQKNITINIGSLINKSELIVQSAQEGVEDIEDKIKDVLLRVLNSANAI